MHWWNYKALAIALREGAVKPWAITVYWCVFVLGYALMGATIIASPSPGQSSLKTRLLGEIIPWMTLLGTLLLPYWVNRAGDNKDFWKRLVCLTFPLNNRYIALLFSPVLLVMGWAMFQDITTACPDIAADSTCVADALLNRTPWLAEITVYAASVAIYFYWLRKAFLIVNGKKAAA